MDNLELSFVSSCENEVKEKIKAKKRKIFFIVIVLKISVLFIEKWIVKNTILKIQLNGRLKSNLHQNFFNCLL